MNKDYHNKFAPDIWCLFGDIIPCILTFYSYLKMDIIIFQFSQNQVTKISRPELCTHVTFMHRIILILFVVMIVCTFLLIVVEESSGLTAEQMTRATLVKG